MTNTASADTIVNGSHWHIGANDSDEAEAAMAKAHSCDLSARLFHCSLSDWSFDSCSALSDNTCHFIQQLPTSKTPHGAAQLEKPAWPLQSWQDVVQRTIVNGCEPGRGIGVRNIKYLMGAVFLSFEN